MAFMTETQDLMRVIPSAKNRHSGRWWVLDYIFFWRNHRHLLLIWTNLEQIVEDRKSLFS